MLSARKHCIRLTTDLNEMRSNIVWHVRMHKRSTIKHSFLKVNFHFERLVFDFNERQRIFGNIAVNGDHHGYRLANVMYLAARQRALRAWNPHGGMGNK